MRGNRPHFAEGFCRLDMALAGGFLMVAGHDHGYGGMDVTWRGIWRRAPRRRRPTGGLPSGIRRTSHRR